MINPFSKQSYPVRTFISVKLDEGMAHEKIVPKNDGTSIIAEVRGYATTSSVHRMETEDLVAAAVRYENGAVGTIDATTAAYPGFPERIEIIGEKATASLVGSGDGSPVLRTNCVRAGPGPWPASMGFQRVAGARCGSNVIFRGPTRRSSSGAIDCRQLAAAVSCSAALIVT